MSEWISVKERLPEIEEMVLGVDHFNNQQVCRRTKWWHSEPEQWRYSGYSIFCPEYWMPLPGLPKV